MPICECYERLINRVEKSIIRVVGYSFLYLRLQCEAENYCITIRRPAGIHSNKLRVLSNLLCNNFMDRVQSSDSNASDLIEFFKLDEMTDCQYFQQAGVAPVEEKAHLKTLSFSETTPPEKAGFHIFR